MFWQIELAAARFARADGGSAGRRPAANFAIGFKTLRSLSKSAAGPTLISLPEFQVA